MFTDINQESKQYGQTRWKKSGVSSGGAEKVTMQSEMVWMKKINMLEVSVFKAS